MHLTRLSLTDFRSYEAAEVMLGPGVTTFVGANGQGKTNLVEAAGYLATFASHRVATDAPLIRQGADRAIVRGLISSAGRESLVEIEINAGRANRVRLNRAPAPRPRDVIGVLRCVLFAPEDITVVKGDPDQRRRYLDDLLVAMRPRYAGVRADYDRVLRQRTALLKSAKARGGLPAGALEVWDDQLVVAGAELTAAGFGWWPRYAAWSPAATALCPGQSGTPICVTGCRRSRRPAASASLAVTVGLAVTARLAAEALRRQLTPAPKAN